MVVRTIDVFTRLRPCSNTFHSNIINLPVHVNLFQNAILCTWRPLPIHPTRIDDHFQSHETWLRGGSITICNRQGWSMAQLLTHLSGKERLDAGDTSLEFLQVQAESALSHHNVHPTWKENFSYSDVVVKYWEQKQVSRTRETTYGTILFTKRNGLVTRKSYVKNNSVYAPDK